MSKLNIIIKKDSNIAETEYSVTQGGLFKVSIPTNITNADVGESIARYIRSNKTTIESEVKKSLKEFRKMLQGLIESIEEELNLDKVGFYMGVSIRIALNDSLCRFRLKRKVQCMQGSCNIDPTLSLLESDDMELLLKKQMADMTMHMITSFGNELIFCIDDIRDFNNKKLERPYQYPSSEQLDECFKNAEEVYEQTKKVIESPEFEKKLDDIFSYEIISINI